MSKELEALNTLYDVYLFDEYIGTKFMEDIDKKKDIIETALKALEIIKEKEVDVPMFIYNQKLYEEVFTCDFYNRHKDQWLSQLTQEEFDLLKEVLK